MQARPPHGRQGSRFSYPLNRHGFVGEENLRPSRSQFVCRLMDSAVWFCSRGRASAQCRRREWGSGACHQCNLLTMRCAVFASKRTPSGAEERRGLVATGTSTAWLLPGRLRLPPSLPGRWGISRQARASQGGAPPGERGPQRAAASCSPLSLLSSRRQSQRGRSRLICRVTRVAPPAAAGGQGGATGAGAQQSLAG